MASVFSSGSWWRLDFCQVLFQKEILVKKLKETERKKKKKKIGLISVCLDLWEAHHLVGDGIQETEGQKPTGYFLSRCGIQPDQIQRMQLDSLVATWRWSQPANQYKSRIGDGWWNDCVSSNQWSSVRIPDGCLFGGDAQRGGFGWVTLLLRRL